MMLGNQSLALLRAGVSPGDDSHGNPIPALDMVIPITGCSVQPGDGSEVVISRDATTTVYTAWVPLSPRVLDSDRVRFDGVVYEIDGPVLQWRVGTPLDHQVIKLREVTDRG